MLTEINGLRIVEIQEVRRESSRVKTFFFPDQLCCEAEAGQFVMVWIPGVDEVPMSLSTIDAEGLCSISVAQVGEATQALHNRRIGDQIGVRGPYGKGFTPATGNTLIVGGGTGVSPLTPLAERLAELDSRVVFVLGARRREELLFLDHVRKILSTIDGRVVAVTEDQSYGLEGVASEVAERVLEEERFDMIYACGPEEMTYRMFLLSERHRIPIQVSLERLMRCAIGLCGSCLIGRFRVCRDGPVFSNDQLREVREEFGHLRRGKTGQKLAL